MIDLKELILSIKSKANTYRAILYILESKSFESAFKDANEADLKALKTLLDTGSHLGLKTWVDNKADNSLGVLPVSSLREKARNLGIPYYYSLSRVQLINAIMVRQDELERISRENAIRDSGSRSDEGTL